MKSEFMLAFNQICNERNLPYEVVLEAIQTALVSAYRRNVGAPSGQNITARIDLETGNARIYAEREIVEDVTDPQVELALDKARALKSDVELGDMLMVESTPEDFGRIAAQTARQVILQRIREAEREAQYAHYIEQEGELVYGTVQSVSSQQVTLNLERTEAILPRREMVPGERHVLHDRVRAYVVEVKKTSRGPQVIVSRSHKKMLQRLLELEVPEIGNGTVEIKAIAREAGSRSKVAVAARQAGVDPVGACVGMRGMRIQSIVKELGGEKVDIIEWSPDAVSFVAKALGPAKVLSVTLEESPTEGKTASVVVPDDQLSLAIGKAGQNARLAAKLTGWRIDIQGVTEAVEWALKQINEDPEVLPALGQVAERLPTVSAALRHHKEEGMPYNAEELLAMRQVIEGVRAYYIASRDAQRTRMAEEEAARKAALKEARVARETTLREARSRIPQVAYELSLDEVDMDARVLGHLKRNGLENVGQVLECMAEGDEGLLKLDGIGPKGLAEVQRVVDELDFVEEEEEVEAAAEEAPVEVEAAAEEAPVEETRVEEVEAEAEVEGVEAEAAAEEAPVEEPDAEPEVEEEAAAEAEMVAEEAPTEVVEPEAVPEAEAIEAEVTEEQAEEAEEEAPEAAEEEAPTEEEPAEEEMWQEPEEEDSEEEELYDEIGELSKSKRRKKPKRQLIYDEETDQVVAIRRHKRNREDWEEYL